MINKEKLREKLAKILKRPQYRGLHSFAVEPLIDATIKVVEECEESEKRR